MASLSKEQATKLLKDEESCDLVIECGGQEFKAHKLILTAKSPFFAKAVGGSFKEGKESRITIEEAKPLHVAKTIVWMYVGGKVVEIQAGEIYDNLKPTVDQSQTSTDASTLQDLLEAVALYKLADLLMMDDLRQAITNSIESILRHELSMPFHLMDHKKEFMTLLRAIFESTSDVDIYLRPMIIKACWRWQKTPSEIPDEVDKFMVVHEPVAWHVALLI